jgi:hypothetical protein
MKDIGTREVRARERGACRRHHRLLDQREGGEPRRPSVERRERSGHGWRLDSFRGWRPPGGREHTAGARDDSPLGVVQAKGPARRLSLKTTLLTTVPPGDQRRPR